MLIIKWSLYEWFADKHQIEYQEAFKIVRMIMKDETVFLPLMDLYYEYYNSVKVAVVHQHEESTA